MENIVTPDFSRVARGRVSSSGETKEEVKEMMTVLRDGAQTHVRINSSSLSIIQTCPRKAYYLLKQNLKTKEQKPALTFGFAVHKALEAFYRIPRLERVIPPNFEENVQLIGYGDTVSDPNPLYGAIKAFVDAGESLKCLPDTNERSLPSGVWMLSHYFQIYINDVYQTFEDDKGPVIERQFSTPLFESPKLKIELFGTVDFVLKNLATGEILPGDHKTSTRLGPDFFNRIKPNHQYTGYIIGCQRELGIDAENFLVNGIQVKSRPLTARGGPPTFTRQITKRTQADIAEFIESVVAAVRSYLDWEEREVWPLGHVDACGMWAGCQFLDVCGAPNELRQNILESKFA